MMPELPPKPMEAKDFLPKTPKPAYRTTMSERLRVWAINFSTLHQRLMARYLRKRGWVAFYLEKEHRQCDSKCCWLRLYEDGEKHNSKLP